MLLCDIGQFYLGEKFLIMKKIKSFEVNHDKLEKGIYISRVDEDITTYDIRMVKPNTPPYLENDGIHTFEHIFATYIRNSDYSKNIIYVGPMGCRTGFYLLTRNLEHEKALNLVKETFRFIENFEGNIPGALRKECGNYKDHNLKKAKQYAKKMNSILENWNVDNLEYNK